MRIDGRLEFGWTQRLQKCTRTAHSGDAQIILSGDAGVTGALDQSATGTGRRRRFATCSAVNPVGFGRRTFSTASAAGSTRLGRQIEIRLWRRCVRKARRHREEEIIREVFIQLDPADERRQIVVEISAESGHKSEWGETTSTTHTNTKDRISLVRNKKEHGIKKYKHTNFLVDWEP